ncbi:nucleolin 2-like [Rhodamnia argentea]|uniref:Nucleolin 2-like n=1 Tax=Rhodamnia argentea TaxID=178133 RepID=A0ABM3HGB2_9MYRT|nr:nucleolin 2-like [Rhodamnia argentea]
MKNIFRSDALARARVNETDEEEDLEGVLAPAQVGDASARVQAVAAILIFLCVGSDIVIHQKVDSYLLRVLFLVAVLLGSPFASGNDRGNLSQSSISKSSVLTLFSTDGKSSNKSAPMVADPGAVPASESAKEGNRFISPDVKLSRKLLGRFDLAVLCCVLWGRRIWFFYPFWKFIDRLIPPFACVNASHFRSRVLCQRGTEEVLVNSKKQKRDDSDSVEEEEKAVEKKLKVEMRKPLTKKEETSSSEDYSSDSYSEEEKKMEAVAKESSIDESESDSPSDNESESANVTSQDTKAPAMASKTAPKKDESSDESGKKPISVVPKMLVDSEENDSHSDEDESAEKPISAVPIIIVDSEESDSDSGEDESAEKPVSDEIGKKSISAVPKMIVDSEESDSSSNEEVVGKNSVEKPANNVSKKESGKSNSEDESDSSSDDDPKTLATSQSTGSKTVFAGKKTTFDDDE